MFMGVILVIGGAVNLGFGLYGLRHEEPGKAAVNSIDEAKPLRARISVAIGSIALCLGVVFVLVSL